MAKEESPPKPAAATISERIGEIKKQFVDHDYTEEQRQEFLKKIRQIRGELKSDEKAKT